MTSTALQLSEYAKPTFKNAAKILSDVPYDKKWLNYVQVKENTANFSNGAMLLRRYCNAPDGLYTVAMDGGLRRCEVPYEHFCKFPNFDVVKPPFESLLPLCKIDTKWRGEIIKLCEEVKKRDGRLVIDKSSMWMRQDVKTGFAFPFAVEPTINIRADYLQIALIEMLQYPEIYFLREIREKDGVDQTTPLIVGHDWGSCALIMPTKEYG